MKYMYTEIQKGPKWTRWLGIEQICETWNKQTNNTKITKKWYKAKTQWSQNPLPSSSIKGTEVWGWGGGPGWVGGVVGCGGTKISLTVALFKSKPCQNQVNKCLHCASKWLKKRKYPLAIPWGGVSVFSFSPEYNRDPNCIKHFWISYKKQKQKTNINNPKTQKKTLKQ